MGKLEDNLERIKKAMRCEPVDRIPVAPCGNAYFAKSEGVPLKDYCENFELACDTNLKQLAPLDVDATQSVIFSPWLLGAQWLSKTAVPGYGLGDDEMWQMKECENMQHEEYEDILKMGWKAWQAKFVKEKCDDNFAKLQPFFEATGPAYEKFHKAGIPCICDFLMIVPFEYFCGGRSLEAFFIDDIMEDPDLMHEVFDMVLKEELEVYRQQMIDTHATGVWIGGWRTGPGLISPPMFEEFVWPSFKAYYDLCVEMDVIPMFHLDADWGLFLPKFKEELEDKTYIVCLDSTTDIRKARETLGPDVCILGDVPCGLLTFGKPEEVEEYVTNLIHDIGPQGVIIASGCDIPSDAKKENVAAMVRAAHNYPV
ncbi:MAG: hypothetical protein K6G01_03365 [Eubacterium sp.]|nr:hypothetical protein [Eubacterium sp.]